MQTQPSPPHNNLYYFTDEYISVLISIDSAYTGEYDCLICNGGLILYSSSIVSGQSKLERSAARALSMDSNVKVNYCTCCLVH